MAQALRLPHASIWLVDGETLRPAAVHGIPLPDTVVRDAGAVAALRAGGNGLRSADFNPHGGYAAVLAPLGALLVVPLTYGGEFVGVLCLPPRGPGEDFSPADRRLLCDLARQAGVVVHAVQLTAGLQASREELRRSRERLVASQEEERRRIQRDLHDGLGPTLASMRLRLEACLDVAEGGPPALVRELERLDALVGQATAEIRRLVYDLRPPVLDQLGLVPALRQHVERFGREAGVEAHFAADPDLGPVFNGHVRARG